MIQLKDILIIWFLLICPSLWGQEQYKEHQPYSSFWFIEELLKWEPTKDPHALFNVSHTPLAKRFVDTSTQQRPELSSEPSIVSLVASHPTTNHPSQGFPSIQQYAFPYWQYIDYFVQWGGASGEGIIVTPAVPWIDAAHQNGVEILGTVFFPPNVYGGKEEWVREFLQKDKAGNFPVADKLIQVADYYGFEGWFINQETHGMTRVEADLMQEFLRYYQKKGQGQFKIMWYDAMIEDGRVIWQDEFNEHNSIYFQQGAALMSNILFIDFGWSVTDLEDSKKKVKALGRSSWELYAGIDVQSRSFRSWANWKGLYDENDKPYTTSIGLYWPNSTFDITKTKEPEEVYQNEQLFWNGTTFTAPRGEMEWKGFTRFFPARSVIQEVPFITHFNYGLGRFYQEEGERLSDSEWHNLSNQDILPSWQWQVDTNLLKVSFDFEESYTGGSCLKLDFKQEVEQSNIPLYKTNLKLTGSETLTVAVQGKGNMKVWMQCSDGTEKLVDVKVGLHWNKLKFPLNELANKTVVKLGVQVGGNTGAQLQLGMLGITNSNSQPASPKVAITPFIDGDEAELYVSIEQDERVVQHNIYQLLEDGGKKWLGQTHSLNYYISNVSRPQNGKDATIEVVAISPNGRKSKPTQLKIDWTKNAGQR